MTNAGFEMPCPVCKVPLTMVEREGVQIDCRSQCHGVWLDRGKLDKIVERSAHENAPAPVAAPPRRQMAPAAPDYANPDYGYAQPSKYPHGKRKKSLLEDLFD